MGKIQITFTYTVATLHGKNRIKVYMSPTHPDPESALQHLTRARMQFRSETVAVVKSVMEILDEEGLLAEIDQSKDSE